jgi:hypothetical protein
MKESENPDSVLVKTAGVTLSKITFYVCCTIGMGMLIEACKVDSEVITQCEKACGLSRGIKEVTGTSCECNDAQIIAETPWVLQK